MAIKRKRILFFFILVNFIVAGIIFFQSLGSGFPDENDYLALAEGILHGQFSSYYYLDSDYPSTLRSPGYPLFLASILFFFDSIIAIQFFQLILYFLTILLALKIVEKLALSETSVYIFLVLSTICIQIPFYSALIASELITIFLVILILYFLINRQTNSFTNNFYTGLAFSLLAMVKPAFLLLPIILFITALLFKQKYIKNYLFILIIFFLGNMPFAIWNKTHHDVLKPSTIEGMATIAHMGYWNFKLPTGYESKFDNYQSSIVPDFTNPFQYSHEERTEYVKTYESEWKDINQKLLAYLPEDFKNDLAFMKGDPTTFITYPAKYIVKREELLVEALLKSIKDDPIYYIKTRAYNFFRVFFTGINKLNFLNDVDDFKKIQMILAFAITFTIILGGFLFISFYMLRNWKELSYEFFLIYIFIIYTAGVHMPFSVQARYSVPVHLCLLILLSIITPRLLPKI